jgi:hypothetical protein
MRNLPLAALLATLAVPAHAQRRAPSTRGPSTWISLSGGYMGLNNVADGSTGSTWEFGSGWPLRVSVERSLGNGASLGVQTTYMRVPLVYVSSGSCADCNAHATVATYGPTLRIGGGRTFYQAFEFFAGIMQYGNFTDDDGGATLPPASPNRDFAFSVGYGFGYALGRDMALELMSSYIDAVHERTNLPGNARTLIQHTTFMLGFRLGL